MMKYILHALVTILILILVVLALFGGYMLWNMFIAPSMGGERYATPSQSSEEEPRSGSTSGEGETPTFELPREAITIPLSNLTDAQRMMLRQVGVEGDTVTITPEQISCAEGKLGAARLAEIQAGATPTSLEAVSLLPCL